MTDRRCMGYACLLWMIGCFGCSALNGGGCTEMACVDAATLTLRAPDDSSQSYAVTLLLDGIEVRCEAPAPQSERRCSDADVSVEHRERADCTERREGDAVSQTCVRNGKFEQVLHVQGTPSRVNVTAVDDGGVSHTRDFTPEYTVFFPNGPACEPQCRQAEAVWVVE